MTIKLASLKIIAKASRFNKKRCQTGGKIQQR